MHCILKSVHPYQYLYLDQSRNSTSTGTSRLPHHRTCVVAANAREPLRACHCQCRYATSSVFEARARVMYTRTGRVPVLLRRYRVVASSPLLFTYVNCTRVPGVPPVAPPSSRKKNDASPTAMGLIAGRGLSALARPGRSYCRVISKHVHARLQAARVKAPKRQQ